ncbi:MAG TPA: ABC transporter permease, partial [Acidimicrobiales bacterium]
MLDGIAVGPPPRRKPLWVPVVVYFATIFVLITANFALPRLMPGDPIQSLMARGSPTVPQDAVTKSNLAKYYQLDESLPDQYVHYLGRLAHGDLGKSINSNLPVRKEIGGKLAWSFLLLGSGFVISMIIGIPLGIHSGWKRGGRFDRVLQGFFLTSSAIPIFVLGALAFIVLAARLNILPYGGATTPFNEFTGLNKWIDIGRHVALPALMVGFELATIQFLVMRSSIVSELGADYLLGGRAKGLRERRLKYRYAARNALLPVVTVLGFSLGAGVFSL